jgi:hypothetical protein
LHFGDRVAVLNVFLYQTGGSTWLYLQSKRMKKLLQVFRANRQQRNKNKNKIELRKRKETKTKKNPRKNLAACLSHGASGVHVTTGPFLRFQRPSTCQDQRRAFPTPEELRPRHLLVRAPRETSPANWIPIFFVSALCRVYIYPRTPQVA